MHVLCSLRVYRWVLFLFLSHQLLCMQLLTQMRRCIHVFYEVLFVNVLFVPCQRRVLSLKVTSRQIWSLTCFLLLRRASSRTKTERNTSTRSQSSLRCLRSLRGSWSSTLTSSARRTSRSSRTLARWDRVCVRWCDRKWCRTLTVVQWSRENMYQEVCGAEFRDGSLKSHGYKTTYKSIAADHWLWVKACELATFNAGLGKLNGQFTPKQTYLKCSRLIFLALVAESDFSWWQILTYCTFKDFPELRIV